MPKREPAPVFISYSTHDRESAVAICEQFENAGIGCWIAPRDIEPGQDWSAAIPPAIDSCSVFVLVFSAQSNASKQVVREVHLAQTAEKLTMPLRVDATEPTGALRYLLSGLHWLDAPVDERPQKITELMTRVRDALSNFPAEAPGTARPAGSAVDPTPNNLPRQVSTFVGRDEDLAEVRKMLQSAHVVTLVGTGGVGKTRLATQVASRLLPDFPDGIWYVELAPIVDPTLVAGAVLAILGVTQSPSDDPLSILTGTLKRQRVLLVLDNCEHVIEEAARVASAIQRACAGVKIVATSREVLNIAGEHVYRLPSLGVPPADAHLSVEEARKYASIALFEERASAVQATFRLTPENVAVVGNVCRRLDGIALAIELAAPRVKMLTVDQLAQRLDERFKILTGGDRAALPRQRTMRALIDWSYDLLSDHEKALFRRIGVFAGGFTLDAASEVCTDEAIPTWDAFDLLCALFDKSLIATELEGTQQRYRMLESMRQYARERLLTSDDAASLFERYVAYFSAVSERAYEEFDRAPAPNWLQILQPDLDNFRVALTWALTEKNDVLLGAAMAGAVAPVFLRLSLLAEGIRWCEAALATAVDLPFSVEARLQYILSMLSNNSGLFHKARCAVKRAVELYRQTDDARALTRALSQLAQHLAREELFEEARAAAQEGIAKAREIGDPRLLAGTLQRCATAFDPTMVEKAREESAESVTIFRSLGRDEETARALNWWAEIEAAAGCYERAITICQECLNLTAAADTRPFELCNITCYAIALGDFERAKRWGVKALKTAIQVEHSMLIPIAILCIACIANNENDCETAARLFGYSAARFAAMESPLTPTEQVPFDILRGRLEKALTEGGMRAHMAAGAALSQDHAIFEASQVTNAVEKMGI
ncbi:MAG: TIR domain-containing protein [Candidatus Eremiobacteraeota bacterium]|nr:TIR domain-containing protein [Candidatus Eremiobacteraeota bacterium]